MIVEDVDHGSHGLLHLADDAGWCPASLLVRGLFVPDLALVGGVHAPHKMVLAPTERLALSVKPGVFLFCEGSGQWNSLRGRDLLQCDALALL